MSTTEPRRLTAKQHNILKWVISYIGEHRFPPTTKEIGAAHGIRSTNVVFDHLNALVRKGYIDRKYFASRSIRILRNPNGSPWVDPFVQVATYRKRAAKLKRLASKNLSAGDPIRTEIDELVKAVA